MPLSPAELKTPLNQLIHNWKYAIVQFNQGSTGYQTAALEAVVHCFMGQTKSKGIT